MKKLILIVIVFVIFAAVGILNYLVKTANEGGQITKELTVGQAEQLILKNSRILFGRSSKISIGRLADDRYFKNHFIFEVYDGQRVPSIGDYVAVNRSTGRMFRLLGSDSFNKVVARFNEIVAADSILISDPEAAKDFATLFFRLTSDPRSEIRLLNTVEDVPFKSGRGNVGKNPALYSMIIADPEITQIKDGFRIDAFTWSYLGGALIQWDLTINEQGNIQVTKREVIGTSVGDYILF